MIDLVYRLRKRAEIRRQISTRKSVQEGKPDRIADLLDEAADALDTRKWERPWVSLTDEEAQWIYDNGRTPSGMMEMVEAKLKEKNT
jgi:hypothetical protein